MTDQPSAILTFVIGFPPSWRELPSDAGDLRDEMRRLLADVPDVPDEDRRLLADVLTWRARQAQRDGVASMAWFAEVVDDPEAEAPAEAGAGAPPALLLSAAVSLAFLDAVEVGGELELDALQRAAVDDDPRVTLLAAPRRVELGCGPAIETVALRRIGEEVARSIEVLEVRYLVPVADSTVLAVVAGTTPCIGLGPELTEVFLRIAESLEVFAT